MEQINPYRIPGKVFAFTPDLETVARAWEEGYEAGYLKGLGKSSKIFATAVKDKVDDIELRKWCICQIIHRVENLADICKEADKIVKYIEAHGENINGE